MRADSEFNNVPRQAANVDETTVRRVPPLNQPRVSQRDRGASQEDDNDDNQRSHTNEHRRAVRTSRLNTKRLALQPSRTAGVKLVELRAFYPRHVRFDFVTDLALQIGEMPIAFREARQQILVEHKFSRRIDRVEPILFVDRLAQNDSPAAVAFLDEIVEASRAHDVADHPPDSGTLEDSHFGLGRGAMPGHVDRSAAKKVQDTDAAGPAFVIDFNELLKAALEPGGHHAALRMPHRPEAIPQAGVAPHGPILYQFADSDFVGGNIGHEIVHPFSAERKEWYQISRPSTFSRKVFTVSPTCSRCGLIASARR